MTALYRRLLLALVFTLVLLMVCNSTLAQGTANGPVTSHIVAPGEIVVIGDMTNPIPIDLDPNGLPWTKNILDPNSLLANGGILNITEFIQNVGTEPWFDWHEHLLPAQPGLPPHTWTLVSVGINGNAIGFSSTGIGTADLWLDNFSQPVLPGDILLIKKKAKVAPLGKGGALRIQEYPTPEPASAALMGIGSLLVMASRRITR